MKRIKNTLTAIVTAAAVSLGAEHAAAQNIQTGYDLTNRSISTRVEAFDTKGPTQLFGFGQFTGNPETYGIHNAYGFTRIRAPVSQKAWMPAPTVRFEYGTGMDLQTHVGASSVIPFSIKGREGYLIPQAYLTNAGNGVRTTIIGGIDLGRVSLDFTDDRDRTFVYQEATATFGNGRINPYVRTTQFNNHRAHIAGVRWRR